MLVMSYKAKYGVSKKMRLQFEVFNTIAWPATVEKNNDFNRRLPQKWRRL